MARFLADENLWPRAVDALRALGHDVVWVRDDSPGISDEEVLERAQTEARAVITSDKGFGDLVFVRQLPAEHGVILLRARRSQADRTQALINAIGSRQHWRHVFAAVDGERVRISSIPRR